MALTRRVVVRGRLVIVELGRQVIVGLGSEYPIELCIDEELSHTLHQDGLGTVEIDQELAFVARVGRACQC